MKRYSFLNLKPYAYRKPSMQIQKFYETLYHDTSLNSCEERDVRYLYLLYTHAIATRKWHILANDVEARVVERIKAYVRILDDYKVAVRLSDCSDRHTRCSLRQTDPRDSVKRSVLEMYQDAKVDVMFEGGMKVFGIEMERSKNLTFLDYDSLYDGENLWYQKIDFSDKLKKLDQLKPQTAPIEEALIEQAGKTKSLQEKEAALKAKVKKSGAFEKDDSRFIIISQYHLSSSLFLEYQIDGQWEGLKEHIMRTEKSGAKGDTSDALKIRRPLLCDFDGFMAGNPYPQMYIN